MARVIAGTTMSLDGFVNDARGGTGALYRDLADWRNTEQGKATIAATGGSADGRRTFEMAGDQGTSYGRPGPVTRADFVLTFQHPTRLGIRRRAPD